MLRRMLTILMITLTSLPVAQAQNLNPIDRFGRRNLTMPISSYEDDPFAGASVIDRMDHKGFDRGEDGRPVLSNDWVSVIEESKIYRQNPPLSGQFQPFAWNPWPQLKSANADGNFSYPDEARFPLFRQERDADGKVIIRDGLQVWSPVDLHLGDTTVFDAANASREAAEDWSGRAVPWGQNGLLEIEPHAFIDFNAFYSPSTKQLFFAVVPYRLVGETQIKMLETATSWEMAGHESGHAIHNTLKPNVDHADVGFNTWGESFGDQTAMWTSLRNPDRVIKLLAGTNGNLNQSNPLTCMGEAWGALVASEPCIRNAFNDKKVSNTTDEEHDRSGVLTGAAYRLLLTVYSRLKSQRHTEDSEALSEAGRILGTFLTRSTDYTPENQMTLEDVAKAYLKVDKEIFGGSYHDMLVDEFIRREIFDSNSVNEWLAHEAAMPNLRLRGRSDQGIEQLIVANQDNLGLTPDFGLKLQSVVRDNLGQTIVRVQLTMGRDIDATPLNNHGILIFRRDGVLADYHPPVPSENNDHSAPPYQNVKVAAQFHPMMVRARQLGLDQHDAPMSIVRGADGRLTMEVRVLRGEGLDAHMEVFTLDKPQGERREILIPPIPPDKRIAIQNDLIN
jgi:hypothetical protein